MSKSLGNFPNSNKQESTCTGMHKLCGSEEVDHILAIMRSFDKVYNYTRFNTIFFHLVNEDW